MGLVTSSASGSGVTSSVTSRGSAEILILVLRGLAFLSKVNCSRSVVILIISPTCATIPLRLPLPSATCMAILTSMAQMTIATCRPHLSYFLSLIKLDCLVFHEASILKLAEINVSKVFNQVSHLCFILFELTNVYYLVHFEILDDYKINKGMLKITYTFLGFLG